MNIKFFILPFITSLFLGYLIFFTSKFHIKYTGDFVNNINRKIHSSTVPRVGGICIFFGFFSGFFISEDDIKFQELILCASPIFFIGLVEDLTKRVSIGKRLLFAAISSLLVFYLMNIKITNIGIPLLDSIVNFLPISLMLTVIAISGLANAYNIIDGNNGLASMLAILTLSGLVVIAYNHSDHEIILLCLAMIGCLFGFFLINFPRGLIFMGDSGAYFTGFIVAIITVSLIQRNESISPWVGLLINALPVTETVFSGFRRKFILGNSPSLADNLHLHSLVFRKLVQSKKSFLLSVHSNPKTSFFIWLFSCLSIIPAVIFQVNTFMLIVTSIFFILLFIWLYKRLLKSST